MGSRTDAIRRADEIAREVLNLSRSTLLVNMRFLDMALSSFTLRACPGTLATDGQYLFYDAFYVLSGYKEDSRRCLRDYLHITLHCVFQHLFAGEQTDSRRWDTACDIAVENVINELSLDSLYCRRQSLQTDIIEQIKNDKSQLNAEKIYRWIIDKKLSDDEVSQLRASFIADDHRTWRLPTKQGDEGESKNDNNSSEHDSIKRQKRDKKGGAGKADSEGKQNSSPRDIKNEWKKISERMKTELETMSAEHGAAAGALMQNLFAVNRQKHDYADFLRRFTEMGEIINVNDEEFDYIFYTYGLSLYKNMPLIESLEYKEVKRIKEFVIAIDTSASVSGELVKTFISKTYDILSAQQNFFTKINVRIIQCDAEIQEDKLITSHEEMESYIQNIVLKGFGGTDFRPVFDHVDNLIKKGEFKNLKGLIYFTDGEGTYPLIPPPYHAAFIFVSEDFALPKVPPWAIRLLLEPDEI